MLQHLCHFVLRLSDKQSYKTHYQCLWFPINGSDVLSLSNREMVDCMNDLRFFEVDNKDNKEEVEGRIFTTLSYNLTVPPHLSQQFLSVNDIDST